MSFIRYKTPNLLLISADSNRRPPTGVRQVLIPAELLTKKKINVAVYVFSMKEKRLNEGGYIIANGCARLIRTVSSAYEADELPLLHLRSIKV